MKLRSLAALLLAACPLALAAGPFARGAAAARQSDAATLIAELKKNRDESDPKLIQDLAALKTKAALDGLIELNDTVLGSIYMRREAVKALGVFDGVPELEQPALQKVADVATNSREPELRAIAVDTLGDCRSMGKHFLKTIVESGAEDDIRQRAMEKVVRLSSAEDKDFFQRVFSSVEQKDKEKDKKDKKKKDGEPSEADKKPHALKAVREMAFEQIAADMKPEQLYEHAKDKEKDNLDIEKWGIRRLALLELERRKDKGLYDLAQSFYDDATERGSNRAEAVRILAEHDGVKIAPQFLEDGCGNEDVLPEAMRMTMADQLAKMRDEATDKALLKLVGKGKPHEQRFVLRALRGIRDEKLAKTLMKEIADGTKKAPPEKDKNDPKYNDERDLVLAMLDTVGTLGDKNAAVELEKLATGGKDPVIVAAALGALGELRGNDAEWLKTLEGFAGGSQPEVRSAALQALGKTGDKQYVPVLAKALDSEDWSTRLAALEGLKELRTPETVAALVGRVDKESELILVRFADALWRLTGKPFRTSAPAWKSWWEKEGASFQPISLSELSKLEAEEEMRRLKQTTKASFFGIRIVSHRVIFILDVSGSMAWELDSEYVGKRGRPRIDVAKEELVKAIDSLEPEALFNVVVFSSDVDQWLDGGIAASATATARDEAKKFVQALGANGATNLYDSLRQAFGDPNCDTIILLSDGEPTSGEEVDQVIIRERVKSWNEHRGVVIHTIAVGGTFQILEWLAQDTGGKHKKFQ